MLDEVQYVLNNSVNESVGETPFFLLYGFDKRMPTNLMDNASPPRKIYNYNDYISFRNKLAYDIIRKVRNDLKDSQEKAKRQYDENAKVIKINVGDQIFVKQHVLKGPNTKLSHIFDGPYRLPELVKLHNLKIIDENLKNEKIVHVNHVKKVKTNSLWYPQGRNKNIDSVATES